MGEMESPKEIQVCIKKMSESEPFDDPSKTDRRCQNQDLRLRPGMSLEVTCLLTKRQPVQRRHDLDTGVNTEQGNLFIDAKGKDKRIKP